MVCVQFLAICDYIIYFPGGDGVAECGSHDELMTAGGAYAEFVKIGSQQSKNDINETILHKPAPRQTSNHSNHGKLS